MLCCIVIDLLHKLRAFVSTTIAVHKIKLWFMSVLKRRIGIGLACERRGISSCCLSPPKNSRYKRQPEIRVCLQARIAFESPEMKLKTLLFNIGAQTDTQLLTS